MRYIANKFGPPEFSGKDAHDKAKVDMVLDTVFEIRMNPMIHFYITGDREAIKAFGYEKLPALDAFYEKRQFTAGDYVTFVDFFVWEQLELYEFATEGNMFDRFPNLLAFHKRVAELPRFSEYVKSDRFMVTPFNSKIAKVNN